MSSAALLAKAKAHAELAEVPFEVHPDYASHADISSLTKFTNVVGFMRPRASFQTEAFYRTFSNCRHRCLDCARPPPLNRVCAFTNI